jgi:hypothetical protein
VALSVSKPPRCSPANVTTGGSIEYLLNPTDLSEKLEAAG